MTNGSIITIEFRGDTLFAVERDEGIYVALKPISDSLGLKWSGQHERIKRDAILLEGVRVIGMPSPEGAQQTTCLKLELVNGWLFGIDESGVRDEETRQRVLAYKRECFAVLFRHFHGHSLHERATAPRPDAIRINEGEPLLTRRSLVTEARQTHGIQAARELWFRLGLPTTPAMYAESRQGDFFYTAIRRDAPAP